MTATTGRRQPYSVRRGIREPFQMHEGVPGHLRASLVKWIEDRLTAQGGYVHPARTNQVIAYMQLPVTATNYVERQRAVLTVARNDPDMCLDIVDYLLGLRLGGGNVVADLLDSGGSVHMVVDDHLEERATPEERSSYESALSAGDDAAGHISEAWRKVFSRDKDASDAWDHAIKAVEALLHDIVSPTNVKGTLGTMIRDMKAKPSKWEFVLSNSSTADGAAFTPVVELLWPNPGRHGNDPREPTDEEARAVVLLATTVVGWLRDGALKRLDP